MTTWGTQAALQRLQTVAATAMGVPVVLGIPESIGTTVSAYVVLMGSTIGEKGAPTSIEKLQRYLVVLTYRVTGQAANAEAAVADLVDRMLAAIYAERQQASSPLFSCTFDVTLADTPDYSKYSAVEYRAYPIVVTVRQRSLV